MVHVNIKPILGKLLAAWDDNDDLLPKANSMALPTKSITG